MSKKSLENYQMHSGTAEMQNFIKQAVPPLPGELKKTWLYRVGYRTGLGVNRAKSLHYDRRCTVHVSDLAALLRAHSAHISQNLNRQEDMAHESIEEIKQSLGEAWAALCGIVSN